MKELIAYLRKYLKAHFHLGLYLTVAAFLGVCIYLNFAFGLEEKYINVHRMTYIKWLLMSLDMGFPFLVICGLLYVFDINRTWVRSREFWLLFVFGFVIIGLQRSFFWHYYIVEDLTGADRNYVRKILWWARPFFTTFIPVVLFYNYYEKSRDASKSWYGLQVKNTDFKPYVLISLVVFVAMAMASSISDLSRFYPLYLGSDGLTFARQNAWDTWVTVALFEFFYGSSFLSVELFFRGFLVLGFARVLGGHAVLAMVGSYVFLHFGKPMTECISSAFGGYLIGILAYYSKRIWGGVAVHVALAWSMELFAWLQKHFDFRFL